jgi:hypothetical protein
MRPAVIIQAYRDQVSQRLALRCPAGLRQAWSTSSANALGPRSRVSPESNCAAICSAKFEISVLPR